jgi:hypothetical protein
MNRPRQIAVAFTALSRRSRFAFRLAKRGSRFCLDNLKTNEHFPKIIQLDDSLLLYGMQ